MYSLYILHINEVCIYKCIIFLIAIIIKEIPPKSNLVISRIFLIFIIAYFSSIVCKVPVALCKPYVLSDLGVFYKYVRAKWQKRICFWWSTKQILFNYANFSFFSVNILNCVSNNCILILCHPVRLLQKYTFMQYYVV